MCPLDHGIPDFDQCCNFRLGNFAARAQTLHAFNNLSVMINFGPVNRASLMRLILKFLNVDYEIHLS